MGQSGSKSSKNMSCQSGSLSSCSADTQKHNKELLKTLEKGDLVKFHRPLIFHWAVYYKHGLLIHLTADGRSVQGICICKAEEQIEKVGDPLCGNCRKKIYNNSEILIQHFKDVVGDSQAFKDNDSDGKVWPPLEPDAIIQRAKTRIGPANYHWLKDNCEHFATWCRYGEAYSFQSFHKGKQYIYGKVKKAKSALKSAPSDRYKTETPQDQGTELDAVPPDNC